MGKNFPDDLRVFDEADDAHGSLAFGANQRINLIYFLNQPCPAFPESFIVCDRFSHAGDDIICPRFFPFTPGDVAVIAVISDHLLASIGDMRAHGRQPFQSGECLLILAVPGSAFGAGFGFIDDCAFLFQITHAFLREGCPDDVTCQILHSGFIFRRNSVAAENIETGMPPCREHGNHLFRDLAFFQKHFENLVPENGFQLFEFQRRGDTKYALVAIKTSVRQDNVAVGIKSQIITKGLDGDDRARQRRIFRHPDRSGLHENFQRFPGATAQTGKKFPIIKKIPAQDFGEAEDEMTVGNLLENIPAEPLSELHHALLMA